MEIYLLLGEFSSPFPPEEARESPLLLIRRDKTRLLVRLFRLHQKRQRNFRAKFMTGLSPARRDFSWGVLMASDAYQVKVEKWQEISVWNRWDLTSHAVLAAHQLGPSLWSSPLGSSNFDWCQADFNAKADRVGVKVFNTKRHRRNQIN